MDIHEHPSVGGEMGLYVYRRSFDERDNMWFTAAEYAQLKTFFAGVLAREAGASVDLPTAGSVARERKRRLIERRHAEVRREVDAQLASLAATT